MENKEAIPGLEVLSVEDQPDGSAIITFDLTDEFKDWFKSYHNIKRFSQKRFEKFILEGLQTFIDEKEKENE